MNNVIIDLSLNKYQGWVKLFFLFSLFYSLIFFADLSVKITPNKESQFYL